MIKSLSESSCSDSLELESLIKIAFLRTFFRTLVSLAATLSALVTLLALFEPFDTAVVLLELDFFLRTLFRFKLVADFIIELFITVFLVVMGVSSSSELSEDDSRTCTTRELELLDTLGVVRGTFELLLELLLLELLEELEL